MRPSEGETGMPQNAWQTPHWLPMAVVALTITSSVRGQPIPPGGPQPPAPPVPHLPLPAISQFEVRRLCVIHDDGKGICVTRQQLEEQFPPQFEARLQQLFSRLYDGLGLNKSQRGLGSCGLNEWATFAVAAGSGQPPMTAGAGGRKAASAATVQSAISACRASLLHDAGVEDFAPDAGYQQWVGGIVARVDGQIAACKDSSTSPIAAGSSSEYPLSQDMDVQFGRHFSVTDGWVYEKFEGRLSSREKATAIAVMQAVKSMEKEIAEKKKQADAIQDPVERQKARDEAAAEESWLSQFVADFVNFILGFDSEPTPAPDPDAGNAVAGDTGGAPPAAAGGVVGQPCGPDADCGKNCASIKAGWQLFKEMCAQSDWKAYNCVAFLRTANGCVDAARVNPGPDGDLTCPTRRSKKEMQQEAYTQQCKRRGWIMLPVDDTTRTCVMPELGHQLPTGIDICTDPRAMPGPDQCGGGAVGTGSDQPAPTPMPPPEH
jgi:hypothetical protein